MIPALPQWAERAVQWLDLGQWTVHGIVSAGSLLGLGTFAAAHVSALNNAGWGAWVIFGAFFAAALGLAAALLAWAMESWSRRRHGDVVDATAQSGKQSIEIPSSQGMEKQDSVAELNSKRSLALFIDNYLLPSCNTQIKLQFRILKRLCSTNDVILDFVDQGWTNDRTFGRFRDAVGELRVWSSSGQFGTISLSRIDETAAEVRQLYVSFCTLPDNICEPSGLDYKTDTELGPIWRKWKEDHNAMVMKYNDIKTDMMLNKFHRSSSDESFGHILEI